MGWGVSASAAPDSEAPPPTPPLKGEGSISAQQNAGQRELPGVSNPSEADYFFLWCIVLWPWLMPLPPCLHLSVTVFEHIGRLLSSVDDAPDAMPVSPVAGVVAAGVLASGVAGAAGGVLASGVMGAAAGAEASGVAGAVAGIVDESAGGVVGAGVASCAIAAVLSARADAKRIIFMVSLQPI